MNQFAELRSQIYIQHAPDEPQGYRRLALALTGERRPLDPVLDAMARLSAHAHDNADTAVLEAELRACLNVSPYLNRYLADAIRNRHDLEDALRRYGSEPASSAAAAAVAVGAGLRPFDAGWTADALRADNDPEALLNLIHYAAEAGLSELQHKIRALADEPLPWGVRAEAVLTAAELAAAGGPSPVAELAEIASAAVSCTALDFQLAQSVFYGDPSRMGKGGSGGMGTLVRELGAALAGNDMPVLTMVCYDSNARGYPLTVCEQPAPGHQLVRMPVYLSGQNPAGFVRAEHRIARAGERALRLNGGGISALHVRFLDDASRAVARVARGRGVPLVTTLTPDPHRSICSTEGAIIPSEAEAARQLFNRILIGDQLLAWSRGVAAIGRNAFADELIDYFPQLEDTRGKVLAAIDEGVSTAPPSTRIDVAALLCNPQLQPGLAPERIDAPMLLSVGRLSPIKGQLNLVRAWSHSDLWRRYNLVLVGGDISAPSEEEGQIIEQIRAERRPQLEGRLCHLPAQDNAVVRALLAWSAERQPHNGADIYVCSSLKEEFGLSILEAMAAGMPVCAPLRGGAQTYVRHGANGFLIDTRSQDALQRELVALLTPQRTSISALADMKRQARQTVEQRYSLAAMAGEYQRFYRRVAAQEGDGNDG